MTKSANISYLAPKDFTSIGHLENHTKYLFNITDKYENPNTKHNLYFVLENGEYKNIKKILQAQYSTNFNDRKFREVAQQRLFKQVKTLQKPYTPYECIKNDLFYVDFGVENTFDEIAKTISSDLPSIIDFQDENIKSMRKSFVFITMHLNQDSPPHLHRLFVLPKT